MKIKRSRSFVLGSLLTLFFLSTVAASNDCGGPPKDNAAVEKVDTNIVATQQSIYQKGQPIPIFDYSQQRASLIQINTAIAKGSLTYSVVVSYGKAFYLCDSIGYPIPATTQLTNPEQAVTQSNLNSNGGNLTLPQAEPVGTYTGNTAATYVLCLLPNGKATPIYSEPDVMAFPYPVRIVNNEVVPVVGGAPSVEVEIRR